MDKTWFKITQIHLRKPTVSMFSRRFIQSVVHRKYEDYPEGLKRKICGQLYQWQTSYRNSFKSVVKIEYWYGLNNYEPFARINSFEFGRSMVN
jgi:hypothetical protein